MFKLFILKYFLILSNDRKVELLYRIEDELNYNLKNTRYSNSLNNGTMKYVFEFILYIKNLDIDITGTELYSPYYFKQIHSDDHIIA